jgi:hypothetical protein
MGEVLDSSRILVTECADDASRPIKFEALRISLDKFVENAGGSRFGELPALSM